MPSLMPLHRNPALHHNSSHKCPMCFLSNTARQTPQFWISRRDSSSSWQSGCSRMQHIKQTVPPQKLWPRAVARSASETPATHLSTSLQHTKDCNSNIEPAATAHSSDQQLPWWTSHDAELQQLEQLVLQLISEADQLKPGAALLELLSAVEVSRSNMLRVGGYFADSLASSAPEQAAAARNLQQAAVDITEPVYASMTLLVLLVKTVHDALQQLAAAAAAAAAEAACSDSSTMSTQTAGPSSEETVTTTTAPPKGKCQDMWVQLDGPLLVSASAAAAAANRALQAVQQVQDAVVAMAACVAGQYGSRTATRNSTALHTAIVVDACAAKVSALRMSLEAIDAACNSTLPGQSLGAAPAGSREHPQADAAGAAVGCPALRQVMLCRHLVASWLPPTAAQAAVAAAAAAAGAAAVGPGVLAVAGSKDTPSPAALARHEGTASSPCVSVGSTVRPAAGALEPGNDVELVSSSGTGVSGGVGYTTRQLLQAALVSLSSVSSSCVNSNTVAPLLLMTQEQAAVIQPLLVQAGLDDGGLEPHQQQRDNSQRIHPPNPPPSNSGCSGSSRDSSRTRSAFVPLVASSTHTDTCTGADAPAVATHGPFPCITAAGDADVLELPTRTWLEVHPGPGGQLLLTDLVDATEQAWQVLAACRDTQQHQALQGQVSSTQHNTQQDLQESCQKHQPHLQQTGRDHCPQQAQEEGLTANSYLEVPVGSQLQLLRVSSDVLQVLMSHHPSPGVRQQLYFSGLLPLLHLQDRVLGIVLNLRQQLAAEQAASGGYAQLILAGSCLGGAVAAGDFIQELLPFARQHAAAEWQELQQLAARQARADGRRLARVDDALEPWDLAYSSLRLVKQMTDLDWGRDLAPYFTLPGLISRIDKLLYSTCRLRLVPAEAPEAAPALLEADQQQQPLLQQHSTAPSIQPWGPHVLHLQLLAEPFFACVEQKQQVQQPEQPLLLGHIFVELVATGFPSCTLLQLPTPYPGHSSTTTQPSVAPEAPPPPQDVLPGCLTDRQQAAGSREFCPGSVVLRVPVPAAARVRGFGQRLCQQQQQPQQSDDAPPLALPGPLALQALLHELGHALSYLCPSRNLQQLLRDFAHSAVTVETATSCYQQQAGQSSQTPAQAPMAAAADARNHHRNSNRTSGNVSSGAAGGGPTRAQHWLFAEPVGVYGLCLLSGPPVGLDVRETSSHLFEHWVRHAASIRALSCHERLGCPLPQHTAVQMPRLMGPPGGCSSMRLYNTLQEALTDLHMHSPARRDKERSSSHQQPHSSSAQQADSAGLHESSPPEGQQVPCGAAQHTAAAGDGHVDRPEQQQQQQSFPPGAALLDDVEAGATAGPVGGAKAAYMAARLIAASAWKLLGFEQDPLRGSLSTQQPRRDVGLPAYEIGGEKGAGGGEWMSWVLLSSGGFLPSHHVVVQLLGGSADVLVPVYAQQRLTKADVSVSVSDGAEGERDAIAGWRPNLYHECFQDVELA